MFSGSSKKDPATNFMMAERVSSGSRGIGMHVGGGRGGALAGKVGTFVAKGVVDNTCCAAFDRLDFFDLVIMI